MLKFNYGGYPVEIWFTPSFNIKTTDKRIEMLFRNSETDAFDPWKMKVRKVKPTKSEIDAYLFVEEIRMTIPELKIEIEKAPEVPSSVEKGKYIVE